MEEPVTTWKAPGDRLTELWILWERPSSSQDYTMSPASWPLSAQLT